MIESKWLIAVISICLGLGVSKVMNEMRMTHEYKRQADAQVRIADALEACNAKP